MNIDLDRTGVVWTTFLSGNFFKGLRSSYQLTAQKRFQQLNGLTSCIVTDTILFLPPITNLRQQEDGHGFGAVGTDDQRLLDVGGF
ncbi:hypothetical protein CLV58_103136 [Spirosoma oryzae]|uniref:Uncharacterized protein n=1 Tax=Spirosoma oryzae TaxID=1469603 RepID=A0A2T0TES5_9BACT|nr:hypothetical protein CLV58_103136 [Spirosoma oryzae]